MRPQPIAQALLRGLVASILLTGTAFGADAAASRPEPSKQMRQKMATLHDQMAACLRSDRAFVDCRTEMMKECQDQIGAKGCGTVGAMTGTGGRFMMSGSSASPPKQ